MICSKITVTTDIKIYIGLHQKTPRHYKKIRGYKVNFARLIVARYNKNAKNGENYEFIGSEFAAQEKIYVTTMLTPGEYHIFGQVTWPYQENCSLVLSTYASQFTPLETITRNEIPNNYLNQILTSLVRGKKEGNCHK
jgi:hypothetical protein